MAAAACSDVARGDEEDARRVGEAGRVARELGAQQQRCGADAWLAARVHEARRVAVEGGVDDKDLRARRARDERRGVAQAALGAVVGAVGCGAAARGRGAARGGRRAVAGA